jgi:hypothetical protein
MASYADANTRTDAGGLCPDLTLPAGVGNRKGIIMKDLRSCRSWLFVPGDSERKIAKCWSSGADAIILDLEDSVLPENKASARATTAAAIRQARANNIATIILVRLNALQTGLTEDDIAATITAAPDGYVAPKVAGASDVREFARLIGDAEMPGQMSSLIPIATEVPEAIFKLAEIAKADERVGGILWGMEDLGTEIGARRTRHRLRRHAFRRYLECPRSGQGSNGSQLDGILGQARHSSLTDRLDQRCVLAITRGS